MPWYDMPLERLRDYRTETAEPAGLDDWWARRLELARAQARPATFTPHEPALYRPYQVHDVEFSGAGGDPVRAWYLKPSGTKTPSVVVKFIGYGGGRGAPAEHLLLPALAVDVALELSGGAPVAVSGASQGGGLALAAAALRRENVAVCHADVPFLCDIQRAITLAPHAPYTEVPEFLAENVALIDVALDTLRYVDCALLARRITATCLLSVALMDDICPPSTVFAAYNEITADKDIAVYPYSGHSVPRAHAEWQLRHLRRNFPSP